MGDVDHGDAQLLLEAADLAPHLEAKLGVQVGERLVHQAHGRLGDDGAAEGHALLLPAGELGRLALEERAQTEEIRDAREPRAALGRRHMPHAQAEHDVLRDRQVGKERVGLEDHGQLALGRRQVGHV